jgi:ABC-type lipoprotein release transport system permease subunit
VPEQHQSLEAVLLVGRGIGNGVADNVFISGYDAQAYNSPEEAKQFESNYHLISGSFAALKDTTNTIPALIAEERAQYLKLKQGDILRVKFTGVNGQTQSAQFKIAGIFKTNNIFMAGGVIVTTAQLKKLAGYGSHDIALLQINLKDPKHSAKGVADRLHDALKPGLAVLPGTTIYQNTPINCLTMGYATDSVSLATLQGNLPLLQGDPVSTFGSHGAIISKNLAERISVKSGDTLTLAWQGKYDSVQGSAKIRITAVADLQKTLPGISLLVNASDFYHAYYSPLPQAVDRTVLQALPDTTRPLGTVLATEYLLIKRCASSEELDKVKTDIRLSNYKGLVVSIQSMYETASVIVSIEKALNLITFVAGMILFIIILIGVVNTLHMTIRERTREIGTIRAIGMQRADVLSIFIIETSFLALFASVTGAVVSFAIMWGLSSFTINATNVLGILLVDGHLQFVPTIASVVGNVALIITMTLLTTYLPSRKASRLSAAEALRHYE